jgi:hypothetical protein
MAHPGSGQTPSAEPANYQAFGFFLMSELPLPELASAPRGAVADVMIRRGAAPVRLTGGRMAEPFIQVRGGACLITSPAGRLLVRSGREILIDQTPGASETDVRLFLLGSALSVLCLQRGLLPLHASVVAREDGAVAFAGPSGAGKSTLAAGLQRHGYTIWCDDLSAVDVRAEGLPVHPGVGRLKLTGDSLLLLGLNAQAFAAVASDMDKYDVRLGEEAAAVSRPLRLRRIFVLGSDDHPHAYVRKLGGAEAAAAIVASVHRWPTASGLGLGRRAFEDAVALARLCPVFRLGGPLETGAPEARQAAVLASLGQSGC